LAEGIRQAWIRHRGPVLATAVLLWLPACRSPTLSAEPSPVGSTTADSTSASSLPTLPVHTSPNSEHPGALSDQDMKILVAKEGEIRGTVVGLPDRSPIEGARLTIRETGLHPVSSDRHMKLDAVTDRDGRFVVGGVRYGWRVEVEAMAPGWTNKRVSASVLREPPGDSIGATITLELRPITRLRGTVTDADGMPVEGADVMVIEKGAPLGLDHYRERRRNVKRGFLPTARTDAAGRFEAGGLGAGSTCTVMVMAGMRGESEPLDHVLQPEESGGNTLDFALPRPTGLILRTLDPDGRPATGILTTLITGPGGSGHNTAGTDSSVTYEGLVPGPHTVLITSEKYAETSVAVDVPRAQVVEREVRLAAGVGISGLVTDAAGIGVAGVRMEAWREGGNSGSLQSAGAATTDDHGGFEVRGLAPGKHYLTINQGQEFLRRVGLFDAPCTGVRVLAGGALAFRLATPAGASLPDMEGTRALVIRMREEGKEGWQDLHTSGKRGWHGNLSLDPATGTGLLAFLPPGRLELVFRVRGFAPVRRSVEIPSGGTVELGTLPLVHGLSLRGVFVDGEGLPVPGEAVKVEYGKFDSSTVVVSAADGSFEIPDLEPGAGTLKSWIVPEDWLPHRSTVNVSEGAPPVRIVLDRGVLVRILVRNTNGSPVRRAWVYGHPHGGGPDDRVTLGTSGDDGTLEHRMAPGAWTISARLLGHPLLRNDVVLAEGAFTITASEGRTIELIAKEK
jgi:protocatechuate 3,4-dioxygenase beta subunit